MCGKVKKAAILKANGQLEIGSIKAEVLKSNQCRMEIKNAGVCSSDVYRGFANGAYFHPLVMGHEFAGIISETGDDVSGFKKGDRVVVFPLLPCFNCQPCSDSNFAQCVDYKYYGSRNHGAFAESLVVNEWNLLKVPNEINLADAALLEPFAVVVHGLKKLNLFDTRDQEGRILLIGYGFLSIMMVELLLKWHPRLKISVIDRNAPKLKGLSEKGVEAHCLKSDSEWESFLDTNTSNYNYVAEMSGHPSSFNRSVTVAKQGAKVLWLSNITDELLLSQKQVSQILRKELTLLGTWNSTFKKEGDDDWKDCLTLIINKDILPSQLVSHYVSLEELPDTLEKMYKHKTKQEGFNCVKVAVDMSK